MFDTWENRVRGKEKDEQRGSSLGRRRTATKTTTTTSLCCFLSRQPIILGFILFWALTHELCVTGLSCMGHDRAEAAGESVSRKGAATVGTWRRRHAANGRRARDPTPRRSRRAIVCFLALRRRPPESEVEAAWLDVVAAVWLPPSVPSVGRAQSL
jgi:hypothetical protein